MGRPKLGGIIVSAATPFREDGSVGYEVLESHLNWLVEQRVHGVMVAGTAGEYANISDGERRQMAVRAVKAVAGRVPVIVQTTHMNRDCMLELTRHAEEAGADAVMLTPPLVVKPTQEEMENYFREAAAAISIDLVIYNNPGRIAARASAETIVRLSEVPNITALKDSGRLMEETTEIVNRVGDRLTVLSGEGDLFLATLAIGAAGGILTIANIAPRIHVELYEAFQQGNLELARELNGQLLAFGKVLGREGKYHSAIKAAMRQIGIPVGLPRPPLTDVSPETQARIREQLELLKGRLTWST